MDRDGEIQRKREKDRYSDRGRRTDTGTETVKQIQRQREGQLLAAIETGRQNSCGDRKTDAETKRERQTQRWKREKDR
jgi:hypothetical protein